MTYPIFTERPPPRLSGSAAEPRLAADREVVKPRRYSGVVAEQSSLQQYRRWGVVSLPDCCRHWPKISHRMWRSRACAVPAALLGSERRSRSCGRGSPGRPQRRVAPSPAPVESSGRVALCTAALVSSLRRAGRSGRKLRWYGLVVFGCIECEPIYGGRYLAGRVLWTASRSLAWR